MLFGKGDNANAGPARSAAPAPTPPESSAPGGGWVPIPDPSKLTTDAVRKVRKELDILWTARLETIQAQIDAQFAAIQKQFEVLADTFEAKIASNDLRYEQRYEAADEAIKAALASRQQQAFDLLEAQKEAVRLALITTKEANDRTEAAVLRAMPREESISRFRDLEQQIERRFTDLHRNIELTQLTADQAARKSDDTIEKRFITLGESLSLIGKVAANVARLEETTKGLDAKIDNQGERIAIAAAAADKAVTKAEQSNEKRFEVNAGLTAQIADQMKNFLTRVEFAATTEGLADKIRDLRESRAAGVGKVLGANALWGYLVGGIGLTATIISVILFFNN